VRIAGFDEHAQDIPALRADLLGRLDVVLALQADRRVSVATKAGRPLGYLSPTWARVVETDLRRYATRGLQAVARATICGTTGDRTMSVLLAWPHRHGVS